MVQTAPTSQPLRGAPLAQDPLGLNLRVLRRGCLRRAHRPIRSARSSSECRRAPPEPRRGSIVPEVRGTDRSPPRRLLGYRELEMRCGSHLRGYVTRLLAVEVGRFGLALVYAGRLCPAAPAAAAPVWTAGRAEALSAVPLRRTGPSVCVVHFRIAGSLATGRIPAHEAMSASTRARRSTSRSTGSRGHATSRCADRPDSVIHAGNSARVRSGCRMTKCSVSA